MSNKEGLSPNTVNSFIKNNSDLEGNIDGIPVVVRLIGEKESERIRQERDFEKCVDREIESIMNGTFQGEPTSEHFEEDFN